MDFVRTFTESNVQAKSSAALFVSPIKKAIPAHLMQRQLPSTQIDGIPLLYGRILFIYPTSPVRVGIAMYNFHLYFSFVLAFFSRNMR